MEKYFKQIENIIMNEEYNDTKKDTNLRMLRRVYKYLLKCNKTFKDIEKEDIVNIAKNIKSRSYASLNIHLLALNDICTYMDKEDCKLIINSEQKDIEIKESVEKCKNRYFTENEIMSFCNLLINPQDKFLVYGLFCGINGKANQDLLGLKVDQIDMDKRIIKLEDRMISIDDFMYDICLDVLDPVYGGIYYKYTVDGREDRSNNSYELNFESPFVIKTKPYSKNNYGTMQMKVAGLTKRLHKLTEITGIPVSPIDVYRSGIMNKMYKIKKEGWTQGQIEEFLKMNNIKMRSYELKRIFEMKYCK